jgi:hypothetical protein
VTGNHQTRENSITPDMVVEATEQDWVRHNDVHQRIGYRRPGRVMAQVQSGR